MALNLNSVTPIGLVAVDFRSKVMTPVVLTNPIGIILGESHGIHVALLLLISHEYSRGQLDRLGGPMLKWLAKLSVYGEGL